MLSLRWRWDIARRDSAVQIEAARIKMRHVRLPQVHRALLALAVLVAAAPWAAAAPAAKAIAATDTGLQQRGPIGGAPNASVYAYSNQTAPTAVGPNDVTSAALGGTILKPLKRSGKTDVINVPFVVPLFGVLQIPYGPPLAAILKSAKPAAGQTLNVNSRSGAFLGSARSYGPNAGNGNVVGNISAVALKFDDNAKGAAASESLDPLGVAQGVAVDYDPEVSASLQVDGPNTIAGVGIYATDSYVFSQDDLSNFVDDGAPMSQTLWSIAMSAANVINSKSNVGVSFTLNPQALSEITLPLAYIQGLPGYSSSWSGTQLLSAVDANITGAITGALTVNGGVATLTDFDPFPEDTTFTANSANELFADGADAGLATVPQPPAMLQCVALIGVVVVMSGLRRRAAAA